MSSEGKLERSSAWLERGLGRAGIWTLVAVGYLTACILLSTRTSSSEDARNVMIWLALAGGILSLAWTRLEPRVAQAVLYVLTLIALGNYVRFGPGVIESIDEHDVIHYYLGAKYFAEIGNFDLYPVLAAVDADHQRFARDRKKYWHASRAGFERRPFRDAIERGRKVRAERFTQERWAELDRDVLAFQQMMGRRDFSHVLVDKGFNATPAWVAYARPIAQALPVSALKYLCLLDVLLLGGALFAVFRSYGGTTLLFALYYLSVTVSLRWLVPGNVFLRYDWVACLLLALCALRSGRHASAGVFSALASLLRFFPAAWLWGPASKGALALFARGKPLRERVDRKLVLLGLAFAATLVLGQGAATLAVGTGAVSDHFGKIRDHVSPEMISSKRPGFPIALAYDGKKSPRKLPDERRERMQAQAPARNLIALGLMGALAFGLRKKRDDEAFAYGYISFFLLTTATYYYHVCRITLLVIHAADPSSLRNRVGLALLFAMEVWSNWATTRHPEHEVMWTGWLSWMLLGYALVMIGWLFYEDRKEPA